MHILAWYGHIEPFCQDNDSDHICDTSFGINSRNNESSIGGRL